MLVQDIRGCPDFFLICPCRHNDAWRGSKTLRNKAWTSYCRLLWRPNGAWQDWHVRIGAYLRLFLYPFVSTFLSSSEACERLEFSIDQNMRMYAMDWDFGRLSISTLTPLFEWSLQTLVEVGLSAVWQISLCVHIASMYGLSWWSNRTINKEAAAKTSGAFWPHLMIFFNMLQFSIVFNHVWLNRPWQYEQSPLFYSES